MTTNLGYERFSDIDIRDPFFDSLKTDYLEFQEWFSCKSDERAYTARQTNGHLEGFLYLKGEVGALDDVQPVLPANRRLKIGTFKIVPHGTRLGERFVKKTFDHAVHEKAEEIYVTIFPRHDSLIQLLLRKVRSITGSVVKDYPLIPVKPGRHFLLALYPEWHSRLLPDSILKTEEASIIADVSHTNSIHKIYLAKMKGIGDLQTGDTLVIYRTTDGAGPAHYRSVATSLCVVEELRHISEFQTTDAFLGYCMPYSIFTEAELRGFYVRRRYPWIIRFTYNMALKRRITRQVLIDDVGLNPSSYWGVLQITTAQLRSILSIAGHDENTLVH